MSALLIYSPKCKHSMDILQLVNSHSQLKTLVALHNVNERGIPRQYAGQIKVVPVMLTKNGKMLVGAEIKAWLYSLLPNELQNYSFGSDGMCASIDGQQDDGQLFSLDMYGQSLQPVMTPDLEAKIKKDVKDAYNTTQR